MTSNEILHLKTTSLIVIDLVTMVKLVPNGVIKYTSADGIFEM